MQLVFNCWKHASIKWSMCRRQHVHREKKHRHRLHCILIERTLQWQWCLNHDKNMKCIGIEPARLLALQENHANLRCENWTNHLSLPFLMSHTHRMCVTWIPGRSTSSQACAWLLPPCRARTTSSRTDFWQRALLLLQENPHTRIKPTNAHSIRESTDGQFHSQFTIIRTWWCTRIEPARLFAFKQNQSNLRYENQSSVTNNTQVCLMCWSGSDIFWLSSWGDLNEGTLD